MNSFTKDRYNTFILKVVVLTKVKEHKGLYEKEYIMEKNGCRSLSRGYNCKILKYCRKCLRPPENHKKKKFFFWEEVGDERV